MENPRCAMWRTQDMTQDMTLPQAAKWARAWKCFKHSNALSLPCSTCHSTIHTVGLGSPHTPHPAPPSCTLARSSRWQHPNLARWISGASSRDVAREIGGSWPKKTHGWCRLSGTNFLEDVLTMLFSCVTSTLSAWCCQEAGEPGAKALGVSKMPGNAPWQKA